MNSALAFWFAMGSALYAMATAMTVIRVIGRGRKVDKILVDRAFGWAGLTGLFGTLAAVSVGWLRWGIPSTNVLLLSFTVDIVVAALFSVYAITSTGGYAFLLAFTVVPAAVGLGAYLIA